MEIVKLAFAFPVLVIVFILFWVGAEVFSALLRVRRSKSQLRFDAVKPASHGLPSDSGWHRKRAALENSRALSQYQPQERSIQARLREIDWFQFEKLVAEFYRDHGWQVSPRGGAKADGGIDLVVTREPRRVAVQCKHWRSGSIRLKEVRELIGSLKDEGFVEGCLATLKASGSDAAELAARHHIEIIDESKLSEWLDSLRIQNPSRVDSLLDESRKTCPRCEAPMFMRTRKRGLNSGSQFWGCSAYPKCRGTLNR